MGNLSYSQYIEGIAQQFYGLSGQAGGVELPPLPKFSGLSSSPPVLIFSPHPDDECLMAGAALRMKEEWGSTVTIVPYSYGSDPKRRSDRLRELKDAIQELGFQFFEPRANAQLEKLTREEFRAALKQIKPEIVFSPHPRDRHPAHIEASNLVGEFHRSGEFQFKWIQTEYWQAAENPNWFVPLSASQVIQIGKALMKHQGEIARNPYHLSLPGWYMDQARRAPEITGLFGNQSKAGVFGQLLTLV